MSEQTSRAPEFSLALLKVPLFFTALILSFPLFEFLFLRLYLHFVLKLKIGYRWMTDYDVIFPGVIAFVCLMILLVGKRTPEPKLNRGLLTANLVAVALFCLFHLLFGKYLADLSSAGWVLWFVVSGSIIGSSAFFLVGPGYYLHHPDRYLLIPAALLAGSKLITRHVFAAIWEPVLKVTSYVTYYVLQSFISGLQFKPYIASNKDLYYHVTHPTFTMAIGVGCSGMEGVSFFIFGMGLAFLSNVRRFSPGKWFSLFLLGAIWMYALNILRLSLFYVVSLKSLETWGHDVGVAVSLATFHNSVGWVLCAVGILLYFRITFGKFPALRFSSPVFPQHATS